MSVRSKFLTVALEAVSGVSAVGAFVVGILAGGTKGGDQIRLLVIGAALVLLGISVNIFEKMRDRKALQTAEDIAIQSQADLTSTLNGALAPITQYLGNISVSPKVERRGEVGHLRQAIVDSAVKLTHERARSAYYSLESGELVRKCYSGRSELPREKFSAGTGDGDYLLALLRDKKRIFADDVRSHPVVMPASSGYNTVIGVPVVAGDKVFGLLTVDAPESGDLSDVDVQLILVLANLLGGGLAHL